jgi:succinyl-diaminopimelate desuccinylase
MPPRADWRAKVAAVIDRAELVELAQRSLQFLSVNPPGDEAPLAAWLAAELERAGIAVELIDHGGGRASVVARLRGAGAPGLILSGHLDVVGAGDRPWQHPPFGGEIADGRVYGRGAADMKGAVAAMVAAALAIRRANAPLAGDLILAFTAGEEVDSLGAQAMIDRDLLAGAGALLIGEPTDLEVYVAEKGNLTLAIQTSGRSAHASMPAIGRNAVYAMADIVSELERYRFPDPPHPLLGAPTISVGMIHGGVKSNVVPDGCTIEVDVRSLPAQPHERIVADLEALLAGVCRRRPGIEARVLWSEGRRGVEGTQDDPFVRDVCAAVEIETGRAPLPGGVTYSTDASVLVPALGVPLAICGPGPREMAHQTDEYVAIDALEQATRIYADVALRRLLA